MVSLGFLTWADAIDHEMSWSADRMLERALVDPGIAHVLVADPVRSVASLLRRHPIGRAQEFPRGAGRTLVHPLRLRRRDPVSVRAAVRGYERLDAWLAKRAASAGLRRPVLVTTQPIHAACADRDRWADVIYYGWDDWAAFEPFGAWWSTIEWAYAEIARRDVAVLAVSQRIVERIGAPRSSVVPNAVAREDVEGDGSSPPWFADLPGPVALYAGTLEERVDVTAVLEAARALPDWTFVLVGHLASPGHFAEVAALPNVHLRGRQPRSEVLAMMARADVCLVPHRDTPLTRAMSPLKIFEYVAAGAHVVATDLPPMRGISDQCLLVAPGEDWAGAIRHAASRPRPTASERAEWISKNDWDARYAVWRRHVLHDDGIARS
ncbi:hypothetical protein GCM10009868_16050 [Terrabacter aerolatus]|uniref:Glycosyl transferase n=1 Tax=Terrabacter aerolatus TaxID=422442 RepID=A0A512D3R1_9MICO|nr:hypothetical protein TAE01_29030 [Terrabacter aerolatus]